MLTPFVGEWYQDTESEALFEVIDWDPSTLTIELQYLDGEVAEYDLDGWRQLHLQKVAVPEDWRNPFELDDEDMLDPDLPYHPEEWNSPLNFVEPDTMYGVEDY